MQHVASFSLIASFGDSGSCVRLIYPKIPRFDFLTFWPIVSSAYFPGEINREIRVTDGCWRIDGDGE